MISSTQSSSIRRSDRRRRQLVRRGFTLLEIIVAVTIVALLATLVAPRLMSNIGKSKSKVAIAEAEALAQQVNLYLLDHNMSQPDDDFQLGDLLSGPDPYLQNEDDLYDPWENPYVMVVPGEHNFDFDIVSYGADGQPGGEGNNKDVGNW